MDIADITFIGSGLATTVTLIELFSKLANSNEPVTRKLNIAVIEKNQEFWLGIPYGSRSSVNALTITCVQDFVYENERPLFFEWLKANKNDWAAYYREHGGVTAARWLDNNLPLIDKEDWETVYIPRFIFGKYILEKFNRLLQQVTEKQLVEMKLIQAEAIDVKHIGDLYEILLENTDAALTKVKTHKLVIATGSAPVRRMYDSTDDKSIYFNDIYDPSVKQNLKSLYDALAETEHTADRNVLVIGSNASSIELLYLLEGREDLRKLINKTVIISPSGLLPYHISTEVIEDHKIPNLEKLKAEGYYTLKTLIDATSADLKLALKNGANVDYIATIITNVLQVLETMGEQAKKEFIGIYGMKLSQMFRRSGPEYKYGSQLLVDLQEVILLKGKYISASPGEKGVLLTYEETETGDQKTYPLSFKAIINCSGSDNLEHSSSRLIQCIVRDHGCKINLSGKGFEVNEKFETAPHLYVMGPLLGGNMNKLIHFWHLENAPRLMYLAPHLAEELLQSNTV